MPRKPIPSFDELRDPLPRRSPKYWYYAVLSLMLRTVGMLSEGIRVGYTHGFDSGAMMNYIYENKPRGRFIIGRLIDQAFLNQITCRAFRSIKKIQKEAIAKQIAGSRGKPLFIADLASGKADYIYDALVESGNKAANVRALLRDINEETLAESKSIAERLNLSGKVRFERADALDVESLRRLAPRPNLVIEVGLYGIIHDDGLIRAHLRHLRQTVKPDALLFNVQNYNPQIELIARALVNSKGERCVWHLRPLEDLIKWAAEAGFCDPEITQDPYGIYSVVLIKSSDYRGADNRNAS